MALVEDIRDRVRRRRYELSKHAVDQSIIRDIRMSEIEDAVSERGD